MIETASNILPLAIRLRELIRREGPISFCDWMKAALYDPVDGYYCRADRNRWGREGDYRTSPERTSLFAATFARHFALLHEELGRPETWTILEAGAGDGHFAAGLLEALQNFFPRVFNATTYVIDEVSMSSAGRARERLRAFTDRVQFRNLDEVEIDPGIVFSNELLDAFPVHRIVFVAGELREFYVTVTANENFAWLLESPDNALSQRVNEYFAEVGSRPPDGQIVEVSFAVEDWLRRVARTMNQGYVVTVDYGAFAEDLYSASAGREGTLRGFARHQFVDDLLAHPGEHDLTTTVNWSSVRAVGEKVGLEFVGLSRQDRFLLANGLLEQLEVESAQAKDDAARIQLSSAAREMILPNGMAAHFQVLVQKK